jgi:hypothetical protein
MRKTPLLLTTLAVLFLASGCASTVKTRTSTFKATNAEFGTGAIAVQPADPSLADSLEFALYRSKVEDKLRAEGYTIAQAETADYVARLGFQVIEDGQDTRRRPRPNFMFRTGFGSYWAPGFGPYYRADLVGLDPWYWPYSHRYHRRAYDPYWDRYWAFGYGPYYRPSRFGYMFDSPIEQRPAFLRTLSLDISRAPGGSAEKPERVYEVKAASKGSCAVMSAVFDEMLAAMFHNFPGDNGEVKTLRVEGETRCR